MFRKILELLPALAAFALLLSPFALQAQAPGSPLTCSSSAGSPPIVRAEGFTELTGDYVITCTGGNPAQPFNLSLGLFINTHITNRMSGGLSDALLLIDDPGAFRSSGPVTPYCVSPDPASNNLPASCNLATVGATYQQGNYTVFRGAVPGPNVFAWVSIPFTPPGLNRTRTLRITNIRANSNLVPYIVGFIPSSGLPLDNPQLTLAVAQSGLTFDVRNCSNTGSPASAGVNSSACRSLNPTRFDSPSSGNLPSDPSTPAETVLGLRFTEGFPSAFKRRIIAPAQQNSVAGDVAAFNSESGFVHPTTGDAGLADTGTRLAARFTGIPSNVRLFVSTAQTSLSTVGATAVLVTSDSSGAHAGTPPAIPQAIAGNVTINCGSVSTSAVEIPVVSGTALAVWEVTGASQFVPETLIFHVSYAYRANTITGTLPAQARVTGMFAPFYETNGGASATLPVPRFQTQSAAQDLFRIAACEEGAAGTPLVCRTTAGVPPVVRAEGHTELAGDILITCEGGDPAKPFTANLQVFLNTPVTNRTASGVTDALLFIDDPGAARTSGNPTPFCVSPGASSNALPAACNPADPAATYQQATYTAFRGTLASHNSVLWSGVPIAPPGGGRSRIIRISNIRADAAFLGVSATLVPTTITAFVTASPSSTLPLDNPQQIVGLPQPGLAFDVRNCGNTGGPASGGASAFTCRAVNPTRFSDPASGALPSDGGSQDTVLTLRYTEGFPSAFKPRIAAGQENSIAGQTASFNSESGFVNPATGAAGHADTGTRVAARFTGIPANVRLFVSVRQVAPVTTPVAQAASSPSVAAVLVNSDANGSNLGLLPGAPPAIPGNVTINCGNLVTPAVEIPVVNGAAAAVWEITASAPDQLETLLFHVTWAYRTNTITGTLPAPVRVTGMFAPFYETSGGASSSLPVPRFRMLAEPVRDLFRISACQTNLLFPYVTSVAGFDTGIAISNTSADPASASNSNSGRCKINYYGRDANGNPPARLSETTVNEIAAGQTGTFILSGGGNLAGVQGNANFTGYIIAQCDFLFGHGFAFITDGAIGQARVAEGYLALVLDGPGSLRGSAVGEERGN